MPLYGRNDKCNEQLRKDQAFLKEVDAKFSDRKTASASFVQEGWSQFANGQLELAILAFNKAWLLDNTNANTYWGLGTAMGIAGDLDQSLVLLKKSIELEPDNSDFIEAIATTYGRLFYEKKRVKVSRSIC